MTSRERVLKVLNHEVPDSVPRSIYDVAIDNYNDSTKELFKEKMGKLPADCFRQDLRGLWEATRPPIINYGTSRADREYRRARLAEAETVADVDEVFRDINFDVDLRVEPVKAYVDRLHHAGYPVLFMGPHGIFEPLFDLRGREQGMMDIAYKEEWLLRLIHYMTKVSASELRRGALAGADIVGIGDDFGSQRGLLLSPDSWRELFKPAMKQIIDAAKNANPAVKFFLHTDGNVMDIIPDFIEIGVDILNPIQPEVMDPTKIKRVYGKELVFCGAISVQHTLPLGTPDDVAAEVKLRMETIGADGGYLMTPSHMINEDIPWENIVAFFEAADKYGNY